MEKISIVIPVYNEEKRIGKTLERCLEYLKSKKYNFEIIVVNDGSTDNTEEVVRKFKNIKIISYKPNHGKGYAVKKGMLSAKMDYVLFSDADLSTPIEELEKLMKYKRYYDIIIASRTLKESKAKSLKSRKFLGRIFSFLVKLLALREVSDTQCGFKLFKKEAARKIFKKQTINGWSFDVEILFIAKKVGYKIKEVGVKWKHFDHQEVTPARQSLKMLIEVLKIRWDYITGKYG